MNDFEVRLRGFYSDIEKSDKIIYSINEQLIVHFTDFHNSLLVDFEKGSDIDILHYQRMILATLEYPIPLNISKDTDPRITMVSYAADMLNKLLNFINRLRQYINRIIPWDRNTEMWKVTKKRDNFQVYSKLEYFIKDVNNHKLQKLDCRFSLLSDFDYKKQWFQGETVLKFSTAKEVNRKVAANFDKLDMKNEDKKRTFAVLQELKIINIQNRWIYGGKVSAVTAIVEVLREKSMINVEVGLNESIDIFAHEIGTEIADRTKRNTPTYYLKLKRELKTML